MCESFGSQLEAKLFKMYLKNSRSKHKHSSWLWTCTDQNRKLVKIAKEPIDNLDWSLYSLQRLIAEFYRLITYLQSCHPPSGSKQEQLRLNLIGLTQSFLSNQVTQKLAEIKLEAGGCRLNAFSEADRLLESVSTDYNDIVIHFLPLVSKQQWTSTEFELLSSQGLIA